jgi:hypothetical protein
VEASIKDPGLAGRISNRFVGLGRIGNPSYGGWSNGSAWNRNGAEG